MMRISKIILCKNIKLDKEYKNVLSYTESDMLALCNTNKITESTNFSFIKPNKNEIEVPFTYLQCLTANYIAFQNPSYANKWFFAFIDEIEYRNDSNTRIKFTVDVFSTWWDYWQPKACYVIREHVNDDTIGANTVPENIERGDYIINNANHVSNKLRLSASVICMGVSYVPENTLWQTTDRMYGGIFSGLTLVVFDQESSATKFIRAYDKMGRGDAIVVIYMIPYEFVKDIPSSQWQTASYDNITDIRFALLPSSVGARALDTDITLTINANINGYVPRCNKLFTFPYNYLSISNNAGTEIDFHYEDFINNTPKFNLIGLETPNCPCMLIPENYKKYPEDTTVGSIEKFYNYGIQAGKLPTCSWQTDSYTNWLTQNGVNIGGIKIDAPTSQAISGSIQALAGAVTGVGAMAGIGNMFNAVQENYRHSLQSPTVNGQISVSDLAFSTDSLTYTYYQMSVREEYARIIDDFWYRYGYQINKIKIPNQLGRENFNYVQIGSSENIGYVENGITASDMEIINNIYRNGVTIWHNHANLGDFSVNNDIISTP